MRTFTINTKNRTIEMTKVFAKAASRYGTNEYIDLQKARADYPSFKVVTKSTKRSGDCMKGFDYDYMKKYLIAKEDLENLAKLYTLIGCDENGKRIEGEPYTAYGIVKEWFLTVRPELDTKKSRTDKKDAIKAILSERKAS